MKTGTKKINRAMLEIGHDRSPTCAACGMHSVNVHREKLPDGISFLLCADYRGCSRRLRTVVQEMPDGSLRQVFLTWPQYMAQVREGEKP